MWLLIGMPAREQGLADAGRLGRDLPRVVEVRLDPDLLGRRQQVDQLLVVEPLRQRHRHARADADDVDVRDRRQAVEEELELADAAASAGRRRRR